MWETDGGVGGGTRAVDTVRRALGQFRESITGAVLVGVDNRFKISDDSDVALGAFANQTPSSVEIVGVGGEARVDPRGVREDT